VSTSAQTGGAERSEHGLADTLRLVGALFTLIVGVIHLEQWLDFINEVPTIGELFILNALGAGAIAIALAIPRLRLLAAVGAIGLSMGAIISLIISMNGSLFDYSEPTFRTPVVLSLIAEVVAVLALSGYVLLQRRLSRPR
jgi:hypothetical protein